MARKVMLVILPVLLACLSSCKRQADTAQKPQQTRQRNPLSETAPAFGTITGTIVIDEADKNTIPQPRTLFSVGKAPVDSVCCAAVVPIPDESLLVNPESRGVKNVFIYLQKKPEGGRSKAASQSPWPTADPAGERLVLSRENCTYHPHAMIVTANERFTIESQDPIVQSYRGSPPKSGAFNIVLPPGSKNRPYSREVNIFPRVAAYPVSISDACHTWMSAYQLPLDHPYAAVTDAEGRFTISDLPAGTHEFTIWHEKGGELFEAYAVKVTADKTTDLGQISLRLSQLMKK